MRSARPRGERIVSGQGETSEPASRAARITPTTAAQTPGPGRPSVLSSTRIEGPWATAVASASRRISPRKARWGRSRSTVSTAPNNSSTRVAWYRRLDAKQTAVNWVPSRTVRPDDRSSACSAATQRSGRPTPEPATSPLVAPHQLRERQWTLTSPLVGFSSSCDQRGEGRLAGSCSVRQTYTISPPRTITPRITHQVGRQIWRPVSAEADVRVGQPTRRAITAAVPRQQGGHESVRINFGGHLERCVPQPR
jgi:hypothetical protein